MGAWVRGLAPLLRLTLREGALFWGSPGNRLMSQLSCFLEMLVQLRSRETGCRRMMPLNMSGVMDLQWFRSMRVHNRLSQHLGQVGGWSGAEPPNSSDCSAHHLPGKPLNLPYYWLASLLPEAHAGIHSPLSTLCPLVATPPHDTSGPQAHQALGLGL